MTKNFIHLRLHSSYSLAEGAIKIEDLVSKTIDNKMPAVAITDSNNLFASLEFSLKAAKSGVQPIIGVNISFLDSHSNSAFVEKIDQMLLIAKDKAGFQNLLKLVSISYLDSKSEKTCCVDFNDISNHSDGLIMLTGGRRSTFNRLLKDGDDRGANEFIDSLYKIFGDRLYIELIRTGYENDKKIEQNLIDIAFKKNIPLIATNDVYFLEKNMHEAHEVLLCIADGKYITQEDRRKSSPENYFKSYHEMAELFSDIPEAIENTVKIAKRCSFMPEENEIIFPDYKVTLGKDQSDELRILSEQGLNERLLESQEREGWTDEELKELEKTYFERLKYELDVIIGMKFPGYFLIVSDFIKWSKRNDIPVGPGRGSGAGSVVAWSLDITDVDPIKFGLLFERFLNPERVSMPDFDIDFCQERRDEVIKYVRSRYGESKVAQIITFGKLQARAVVRDVGRVMQMPYGQVDRISKMIPFNPVNPVTLSKAIELEPELKLSRNQDPEIEKLLDISLQLEGLNRHASTHAAGIVISNKDLVETVPLYKDQKSEMQVIQYSMKFAEAAGLIKFDFLGLKTLTVISKAVKLIRKYNPEFDIRKIPYDDKPTFAMLGEGESVGVFQFESPGMRDSLRKMKPDTIYDINALGALYRPGPMDNIPTYIACKHGTQEPNYLHPKLKHILEETFGVIIYQEQVMEIARVLSGYTLGAADLLRRAMGKKIKEEMDAQCEMFVQGAIENQVSEKEAKYIFDLVAKFAGYGFNKSHATAYGLISYQTAYLKANYPVEMLVALLNNDIDDTDKINLFIDEAKRLGVGIIRPNVNISEAFFTVDYDDKGKGKIIYGLAALKNVGSAAMGELVREREENGKFKDIFDFFKRLGSKVINKRQLESLIKSGSLDCFIKNRNQLLESMPILVNYNSAHQEQTNSNQINLFSAAEMVQIRPSLIEVEDWPGRERLDNECLSFGFYLNAHPLGVYKSLFKKRNIIDALYIKEDLIEGYSNAKIAAIPISVKTRTSPKGRYVSCLMSTPTGMIDVAIFDDSILEENRDFLYNKAPLLLDVDIRKDDGGARVSAKKIEELEKYFINNQASVLIKLNDAKAIAPLKNILADKESKDGVEIQLEVEILDKNILIYIGKYRFEITEFDHSNLPSGIQSVEQI